ncbi:MAG: glycoside hydrolase family 97 protein [Bacteroidota bacterium]
MQRYMLLIFIMSALTHVSFSQSLTVTSPDGELETVFSLTSSGIPTYQVTYSGKPVIDPSELGFSFRDQLPMRGGWEILRHSRQSVDETYELPWGEQRTVHSNYQELTIFLQEIQSPKRLMNLSFRVFNDGLGFRYEFPRQEGWTEAVIMDENTQFQLTGDHMCWWIPGDWDIYEHLYKTTKFSEIDAIAMRGHPNLAQSTIPENAVNTPVTMRTDNGLYLSFHEANLTDYAGMTLKAGRKDLLMQSELVGSSLRGYKAKRSLPFNTPWRTIQIATRAGDLIESNLIINLNEPNKLGDVSWFKPTKYTGIWWDMHLDRRTWSLASGRHGATTEYAKKLIDFSADNGINAMLVEGWNTGWERWIGFEDREGVFDFVTPYEDYDLEEVVRYGKSKGVDLIMHHETSAAPRTYTQQLDTAYKLMDRLGIRAVKTGYVGKIIPAGEYHHGQWMVNHYRQVLETAAKYNIAINAHEPIKGTGIRRTYPNAISREGLRGQEFNAWASDGGNPAEHLSIVAFTRMLAGPIDYTPGIFNIKLTPYKDNNQVNTTLAQQLALYVVIYSPIQMAPDLMEHYEGQAGMQFIRDVGVDWEQSKVLNGEPGDFVTIAREEKETGNWFIGSITDENSREVVVNLDFLEEGVKYQAVIYQDGPDAHWDKNPTSLKVSKAKVKKGSILTLPLAPGGGAAISLMPKK